MHEKISTFLSKYLFVVEKYLFHLWDHRQTNNTGLVGILAIFMIFVSFISNKPGSMWPLLQANVQYSVNSVRQSVPKIKTPTRVLILDGVEYLLIPRQ